MRKKNNLWRVSNLILEEPVKIFEEKSNLNRLVFQNHPVGDMERKLLCESRQPK